MSIIKWNDNLSVGIKQIDDQHKVLIEMINDFYVNIRDKANSVLISELIKKMKDYAIVHFETEERLFREYGYTGYIDHKKEHDAFNNKVADLERRYNLGEMIISFEVTTFLKNWLINHIKGTDMKYSEFLISKGVK